MTNDKQSPPSPPKYVGHQMAFDSAEHLFAAFPVLMVIARWTGEIGKVYIKELIRTGNIKKAKRNAAIIVAAVGLFFLLIMGSMIWLAML